MGEPKESITEASRLRCSYAELRYWESQGVPRDLLQPEAIGSVMLIPAIEIKPLVAQLISSEV